MPLQEKNRKDKNPGQDKWKGKHHFCREAFETRIPGPKTQLLPFFFGLSTAAIVSKAAHQHRTTPSSFGSSPTHHRMCRWTPKAKRSGIIGKKQKGMSWTHRTCWIGIGDDSICRSFCHTWEGCASAAAHAISFSRPSSSTATEIGIMNVFAHHFVTSFSSPSPHHHPSHP